MKKIYFLIVFLATFYTQAQIVNIPNATFKAKLLEASPSNTIASIETPIYNANTYSWDVSTYNTIDTNGDGEIQVSEANLIKYLNVSNSSIASLEGINSFPNLQSLDCSNSSSLLTSLDVTSLTNLNEFDCGGNQITSLNINNLTNLTNLSCSGNVLQILDVSGLVNLITLDCSSNLLTNLNVSNFPNLEKVLCRFNLLTNLNVSNSINLKNLTCGNNQLTNLNTSGLINLKDLSCESNQLIDLNLSGLINLIVLRCEYNQLVNLNLNDLVNLNQFDCRGNQLTSLNTNGLINLMYLYCTNNQLQNLNISDSTELAYLYTQNNLLTSLNVMGLTKLETIGCGNNQLTSLFIKNNNSSWFSLMFDNNPNLTYICSDEEDISLIQTKINSYGYANTCQVNSYCSFTPGDIFYTINGLNKLDGNGNGCEPTDSVYPNLKFSITNGSMTGRLISDISGNYSIPVAAGTHTITPQFENPSYFTTSPPNATVTFPATASPFTQNFCIIPNGAHHDLEVVIIPLQPARPGFDAIYKIKYKNKGTVTENTTITFNYNDAILDYISSTLTPNSQSTGSLSWDIGTVTPFQSGEFIVTLNVNSPTETPAVNAGNVLNYSAVINSLNTDETPTDNTFSLNQIVVNSFDPNDKTCLEGNTINPSMIGEYVHYKIRFENTGTFPAQNIVVKDMIDTAKFDISTLQMTDASHSCVTRISNPNKVEFIFENINLPFDDATNDGYVVFKIKTKNTLVVGNTISNLANIYFDYNFPIVTNTATSTFQVLQNDSFVFDSYFSIYPNPAQDVLNLNAKQDVTIYSLSIYSILGQQVQTITNPEQTIDVSGLPSGNYLIKIVTDKGISSSKFIKE